jgi:hypothetical protein
LTGYPVSEEIFRNSDNGEVNLLQYFKDGPTQPLFNLFVFSNKKKNRKECYVVSWNRTLIFGGGSRDGDHYTTTTSEKSAMFNKVVP